MSSILYICALPEEKKALTDILPPFVHSQCLNTPLSLDVEHYQVAVISTFISVNLVWGMLMLAPNLPLILTQFQDRSNRINRRCRCPTSKAAHWRYGTIKPSYPARLLLFTTGR